MARRRLNVLTTNGSSTFNTFVEEGILRIRCLGDYQRGLNCLQSALEFPEGDVSLSTLAGKTLRSFKCNELALEYEKLASKNAS